MDLKTVENERAPARTAPVRRRIATAIVGSAALALAGGLAPEALAQSTSDRPIRLVVPFAPGGATDLVARTVAERMAKDLGRPMVVENKPGAGGHLGSALVAQSAPDGQTLLLNGTGPMSISMAAGIKLNYDPMKDLAPVAMLTRLPNLVVVNAALPVRSVADFVSYVKTNPGKVTYGMSAIGNLSHLNAEMFAQMAGIQMAGVAYKGTGPQITDLIGGTIQVSFDNLPPFVPHVKSGKLRALAVTSATRSPMLPDVPSLSELGYTGFDNAAWFGIFAPAGLPKDAIERLHAAFARAVVDPEVVERLRQSGVEAAPGTPEQLADRLRKEREQFGKVMATAGIRLE